MKMAALYVSVLLISFIVNRAAIADCSPPPLQAQFAIDYSYPPYNQLPNIADNPGLSSEGVSERTAAMSNAIGAYRSTHGLESAQPGTAFMITYQDGAVEEGQVQLITSDVQALPVPGSFESAEEVEQCAAQQNDGALSGGGGGENTGLGGNGIGGSGGLVFSAGFCHDYYSGGSYIGTSCPHAP